jgi:hypothetical protein
MLRILRIVFGFVVNSGCKSDMKIMKYAIDVLKMNITDTSDICARVSYIQFKRERKRERIKIKGCFYFFC